MQIGNMLFFVVVWCWLNINFFYMYKFNAEHSKYIAPFLAGLILSELVWHFIDIIHSIIAIIIKTLQQ